MEDRKYNVLTGIIILLLFMVFCSFAFFKLSQKKEVILAQKEQEELLNSLPTAIPTKVITTTPTTIEEDNLVTQGNTLNISNISNYPLNELTYTLNGADCELPFTVRSMVSYGYLFKDKIGNDENGYSYTYNQLSEYISGNSYSSFIDTLSPNNQIVSILVKNTSDDEQMILNCDVYGISVSSTYYGTSEVMPTFELSNGLYLGISEGEMLKIMGNYDSFFFVDDDETIKRYQWYQTLDGETINNILTCDIINGVVHLICVEN